LEAPALSAIPDQEEFDEVFPYIFCGFFRIGSTETQASPRNSRKKQLSRPVWQAIPPTGSTDNSNASPSQSTRIAFIFWT
jgi:hypothetical protein